MEYEELWTRIEKLLSLTKYAILATSSKDGIVTASKMCMIAIGSKIYFQTCEDFEKAQNIRENSHVAVTLHNVYFKGEAKIVGHPTSNPYFIKLLKERHFEAYDNYSNLESQILIEIDLTECRIWGIWENEEEKCNEAIKVLNLSNKSVTSIKCANSNIK